MSKNKQRREDWKQFKQKVYEQGYQHGLKYCYCGKPFVNPTLNNQFKLGFRKARKLVESIVIIS